MLKHLITASAVVAGCVIAAAASHAQGPSQTTLTGTVRATPEKAGTVRRPTGVKVQGKVRLMTPEGEDHPIVTAFEIWYGTVTFINATGGRTAAWFVLNDPARVQAAAVGTVVDSASGPWPHRETYRIPQSLQVVAGIPVTLNGLSFAIGGKSWAKTYTASTGCPAGGWAWKVRVHTREATEAAAVIEAHGRTSCHR
jgi:hypothetical protein